MSNIISDLTSTIVALTGFFPTLIGFMSMVASILPPPDPSFKLYKPLTFLRKWINILAFNIKHAKNKD